MTQNFSNSAHILNSENQPKFVVCNKNLSFTGIEAFGRMSLDRALTLAEQVHELETASYAQPYQAAVKNILANFYFQAARAIDTIVSGNLHGTDATELGHRACDAVRDFLGAAEDFQVTFLSRNSFHAYSTREVPARGEGQEPQLITLTDDLKEMRKQVAEANSALEDALIFSSWMQKAIRL